MIASIGFVAGEAATPVPNINGMALSKAATLRGILIGNRDQFEDMNAHIEANSIKPLIDRIFPFAELKQGYEYLASQKVRIPCLFSPFCSSAPPRLAASSFEY